ncbi:hypothetical protein JMJ77_0015269 [Colletotrichum scovillei]|uniref:Uncharacterized protein n=1 Tax=Colletotrichum scovillei TaxID=1209932 RepID=A0A9P7R1F5_9PEZI|nr:hypothetical protein JMJ77_0015269 [Colletotrichum scovillei]KAG7056891.1 hypothetical protein JMJ78_0000681 [Colletotrichum scovillei]KAG7066819.1 hypothetical protein JMJ76_0000670 [Colletotrichum scovillei]
MNEMENFICLFRRPGTGRPFERNEIAPLATLSYSALHKGNFGAVPAGTLAVNIAAKVSPASGSLHMDTVEASQRGAHVRTGLALRDIYKISSDCRHLVSISKLYSSYSRLFHRASYLIITTVTLYFL